MSPDCGSQGLRFESRCGTNRVLSQRRWKAKTTVTPAKKQSAHAQIGIVPVLLIFTTIRGHDSVRSLSTTEELYHHNSPVVFASVVFAKVP